MKKISIVFEDGMAFELEHTIDVIILESLRDEDYGLSKERLLELTQITREIYINDWNCGIDNAHLLAYAVFGYSDLITLDNYEDFTEQIVNEYFELKMAWWRETMKRITLEYKNGMTFEVKDSLDVLIFESLKNSVIFTDREKVLEVAKITREIYFNESNNGFKYPGLLAHAVFLYSDLFTYETYEKYVGRILNSYFQIKI